MPISTISSAGLATGGIGRSNMYTGAVLQVVSTAKTDTFSTASTSFVDVTGLSVSITPISATSKIFISFMFNGGVDTSAQGINMILVRNSTAICIGDTAGSRPRLTTAIGVGSQYSIEAFSGSFLDSPSTTSATTYKVQMQTSGGVTAYVNRGIADRDTSLYDPRTASTITVMEIAA